MRDAIARLAAAGFDVAHAFDVAAIAHVPGCAMLARTGAETERLGVIVGNTRALWPVFQAARRDEPDPLDRYTERTLDAAFPGARIYYGHRCYDAAYLPLGQIAAAVGLGALAPSHLVVHPVYGPWLALRAVILLAGEPPVTAPIAPPCQCDAACTERLAAALTATSWRAWLALRDACPLRAHRYSEDQISFHYASLAQRLPEE